MGFDYGEIRLPDPASRDRQEEVWLTLSLIGSLVAVGRVLEHRDLDHPEVKKALEILRADPVLARLLKE